MASTITRLMGIVSARHDPRHRAGRVYRLSAILGMMCVASLCGYQTYGAMAEWCHNYGRIRAGLGTPSVPVPLQGDALHSPCTDRCRGAGGEAVRVDGVGVSRAGRGRVGVRVGWEVVAWQPETGSDLPSDVGGVRARGGSCPAPAWHSRRRTTCLWRLGTKMGSRGPTSFASPRRC